IELNVKGKRDLRQFLIDYVAVETLEGDYRYPVPGQGLQRAKKGVLFRSFPPVIRIRLLRSIYDVDSNMMIQCKDRFSFPSEVDMEEFLDPSADHSESHVYQLHAVIVHSGEPQGGHYYAFIRPNPRTRWLKFDGELVIPASEREVFDDNYGSELQAHQEHTRSTHGRRDHTKEFTSAYALVYIRKSRHDAILKPLTENDRPQYFETLAEDAQVRARRRESEGQRKDVTVKVVTEQSFRQHQGFDIVTLGGTDDPPPALLTFRVPQQESYYNMVSRIVEEIKVPRNRIRLWDIIKRQNKSIRPNQALTELRSSLSMSHRLQKTSLLTICIAIGSKYSKTYYGEVSYLFLDLLSEPRESESSEDQDTIMIFLKYFDANKQELYGVGNFHVKRENKVEKLSRLVRKKMGWPQTSRIQIPLVFYEEIHAGGTECRRVSPSGYGMSRSTTRDLISPQDRGSRGQMVCNDTNSVLQDLRRS
ncbi:11386_t:CDS:2, partial [Acaulospora colombiana]